MKDLYGGFAAARWPRPADPAQAEIELKRWHEAASEIETVRIRRTAEGLATDPQGRTLLASVFGNSPYLTHVTLSEPDFVVDLLRRGPDKVIAETFARLRQGLGGETDEAAIMAGLRRGKRQVALIVALADIAGLWTVEQVTEALSDCAETSLELAARHLLRRAGAAKTLRLRHPKEPERDSGLVILGMGKLGARELNYSSDIDLIVLYDTDRVDVADRDDIQQIFVRLTRNLVKILEEARPEGYVFRTDLRLRPDPGSTPLALSVLAAETYYESLGQNWERAAMIKARPVAGDRVAGAEFLGRLRPYIWRKHLDFAAIQDIHSIKRQINAHRGGETVAVESHNIKLGRGGIREVEFFAQTQQLIWGGRHPELRSPSTCPAIEALAQAGRVTPAAAKDMIASYRFLRVVEHRLQMTDDKQVHTLPEAGPKLDALAAFLGYPDTTAFRADMLANLTRVEKHYAQLFEEAPTLSGSGSLVFTGTDDDPATIETLTQMGYTEPSRVAATVRGWHHGRYRAMRSVRARELLTELMPALLQALARTAQPDEAFVRFDRFLSQLPAGVQIFSLFHANPKLLNLVADVMGDAPRLAELLAQHTNLLDSVLSVQFLSRPLDAPQLADELQRALGEARDFQDTLDVLRRWKGEQEFQIGVQMLHGIITATFAGAALANIAECTLAALQVAVEQEFARIHGRVKGGAFTAVAYGKLGGREMTVTSDLDLIFLWEAAVGVENSDGAKPLPISTYYQRLAQRLINAISAPTGEGKLYEIDIRLRPSGSKGPLATNLEGFVAYQRDNAWTWEHQALTRARPITGDATFQARVREAVRLVLTRSRDPVKLAGDVTEMRTLMAHEHPALQPWDIKHWRGGLIDVEFIAQYLQLRYAQARPGILATNTAAALLRAVDEGVLVPDQGQRLQDALRLWQTVQGLIRLTYEGEFDPAQASAGLKTALARAANEVDFAALEAKMRERSSQVLAIFNALIPPPAVSPAPPTKN